MVRLQEYIGKFIFLGLNAASGGSEFVEIHVVKLRGVEAGGIWIESRAMTESFRKALKEGVFPQKVLSVNWAHFLPYSRIASVEVPVTEFDPEALGLTDDS